MPTTEERLYRPDRINVWFAASSVLMLGSLLWLVKVDYDRPWHEYQDDYYTSRATLAHLDYLDQTRDERLRELEEAKARVRDIREITEKTKGPKLQVLGEELAEAQLNFKKANDPWSSLSQILEVTKDTYERTLGRLGPHHPETEEAHARFRNQEDELDRLRKDKERWEDRQREIRDSIAALDAEVRVAEKRLRELELQQESSLRKDEQFRGVMKESGLLGGLPIIKWIINAPLLDFTAPKNTPGRYQVNQLVLPKIRQQLNYLETYTTDRCTTCHLSIADPEYSVHRLAEKLERSIQGINDALTRMGRERLEHPEPPRLLDGRGIALPRGDVTSHWSELTKTQQDEYFSQLLSLVNHYLDMVGRPPLRLNQPLLAHPDLDLYVTTDSPHPMAQMGCTVCHEGNPQDTDFVMAAHSAPTHEIQEEWKRKYYVTRLGVPTMTFSTMEHFWDRPMRLPRHTESGCSKCHTEVADIAPFEGRPTGTRINVGRHLFATIGCVNCHAMDDMPDARRVGPDLSHIAEKLKPEFVQQWVFFPQKFRPTTRMPHFFHQENNDETSANQFDPKPELRVETEVAAITHYLFSASREWKPMAPPENVQGDPARGRETFNRVGCTACHSNLTEYGESWITAHLRHAEDLDEQTAGFRFKGMTYVERARYALEHFASELDAVFDPSRVRFNPDRKYTPPVLSRVAPELTGIGSKVTSNWLYSWVADPRHYAPDTKMPNLRLSPQEAVDVASYLSSLVNDQFKTGVFELTAERRAMADDLVFALLSSQRSERRSRSIMEDKGDELTQTLVSLLKGSLGEQPAYDLVRGQSLDQRKLLYLGNKMVSHYGCYACHKIPGFEDATPPGTNLTLWAQKPIAQLDFAFYGEAFHDMREKKAHVYGHVYPMDADELNEWSRGENPKEQITHTHAAFAMHKMINPRIWDREKIKRPYDKLKMPNFYFTEAEAEALTTYLLSRTAPRVSDSLRLDSETPLIGPIAKGRQLTRELNCVGCHQFEDNAPPIQQYFRRALGGRLVLDEVNAPPRLWGEGAKVQHAWLHRFLNQVEPLRPWLQIRMPSFQLTGEESTTLVEYFAALSRKDSNYLHKSMAPIKEHLDELTKEDSSQQGADKEFVETGSSRWFESRTVRRPLAHLRRFGLDRNLVRESEVDPLTVSEDRLDEVYREKLLKRAEFLANLYDVQYPFVEPPRPLSPPDRFERGRNFFNDMGCLQCHVFGSMLPGPAKTVDDFVQMYRLDAVRGEGDQAVAILNGQPYQVGSTIDDCKLVGAVNVYHPNGDVETKAYVEGPGLNGVVEQVMLLAPSAPNLALTHQRLRRSWVFDWMRDPQVIQPGTKMPQNFGGDESPLAAKYQGTGIDHINLLVDYLYDAGITNTRSPVPKLEAPGESEEFDEGGGEPEEFEE